MSVYCQLSTVIAAEGESVELVKKSYVGNILETNVKNEKNLAATGLIVSEDTKPGNTVKAFIKAIAQHRFWERETKNQVPA